MFKTPSLASHFYGLNSSLQFRCQCPCLASKQEDWYDKWMHKSHLCLERDGSFFPNQFKLWKCSCCLCHLSLVLLNRLHSCCWTRLQPIWYVCVFLCHESWVCLGQKKAWWSPSLSKLVDHSQAPCILMARLGSKHVAVYFIWISSALAIDFIMKTSALWCHINITPILPISMGDSWRREHLILTLTGVTSLLDC